MSAVAEPGSFVLRIESANEDFDGTPAADGFLGGKADRFSQLPLDVDRATRPVIQQINNDQKRRRRLGNRFGTNG